MKRYLILLFLLFTLPCWAYDSRIAGYVDTRHYDERENFSYGADTGTEYYLSPTGTDSGACTSASSPCRTFAFVFAKADPGAGASVLCKAGVYRERITLPSWARGASTSNYFVIGPYGDGEVIIDNSMYSELGTWTAYDSNIWSITTTNNDVGAVILNDKFKDCHEKSSLGAVTSYGDWYYDSGTLYLYTNGANPAQLNPIIVKNGGASSTNYVLYGNNLDYVKIYGITFRGGETGIYIDDTDGGNITTRIEKCKIKYMMNFAIKFETGTSFIYENYLTGNWLYNWPYGNNGINESGTGWGGVIITGDGEQSGTSRYNIIIDNAGEGWIGTKNKNSYANSDDISENIFFDNFFSHVGMYDMSQTASLRNFYGASDTPNLSDQYGYPSPSGTNWENVRRWIKPNALTFGDKITGGNWTQNYSWSDIMIGCRKGIAWEYTLTGSNWANSNHYMATIILPDYDPTSIGDTYIGIDASVPTSASNTKINNNIIIGTNATLGYLMKGITYSAGMNLYYNLYYHPNNANPFIYNGSSVSYATWESTRGGYDYNTDPLLRRTSWASPTTQNKFDTYPTSASYALGTSGRWITLDSFFADDYDAYDVRPISTYWDAGAWEYSSSKTFPTPYGYSIFYNIGNDVPMMYNYSTATEIFNKNN